MPLQHELFSLCMSQSSSFKGNDLDHLIDTGLEL